MDVEESVRLLLKKQHPVKRQPHSATILKKWRGEESPSVLRWRGCQFWALKSIACGARRGQDWEFDGEVWVALVRMLLCFANSGYLGDGETILEFTVDCPIPEPLRAISTYL